MAERFRVEIYDANKQNDLTIYSEQGVDKEYLTELVFSNIRNFSGKINAYVFWGDFSWASLKKKGEEITPEKEAELFNKIKDRYDTTTNPYYAAARLWVDDIIDPLDTRKAISMGIEAADHAPIEKPFSTGVLQV